MKWSVLGSSSYIIPNRKQLDYLLFQESGIHAIAGASQDRIGQVKLVESNPPEATHI